MQLTTSYQRSSTVVKPRTVRPRVAATKVPALEYDGPSSLPLHSPLISNNNWCDLLATTQVIQYPDDILITGWGSPHTLDPPSIRLWRTLPQHCMQSVHDSQSLTTSFVPSKEDQCPDKR